MHTIHMLYGTIHTYVNMQHMPIHVSPVSMLAKLSPWTGLKLSATGFFLRKSGGHFEILFVRAGVGMVDLAESRPVRCSCMQC